MHWGYFDITQKGNYSSFLTPTVVGGWHPFLFEICTESDQPPLKNADLDRFLFVYNVSAIKDSKKKFNYDE